MLIGAFALGQAGPNLQVLLTAAGAADTIFETIERVCCSFLPYLCVCDEVTLIQGGAGEVGGCT